MITTPESLSLLLANAKACDLFGQLSCLLEAIPSPGPLAFHLLVERLNNRLSSETRLERVQRLIAEAQRVEG